MFSNKVLIIDDDDSIIKTIRRQLLLQNESYEVVSATNGREGLSLYKSKKPALIILDLNMPVMGGIAFLEEIKLTPSHLCSVIILTGQGDDDDIRKCFDLGVSAFLGKPFNNYELMGLTRHCISLKNTRQELLEEIYHHRKTRHKLNQQRERFISVLIHDLKNSLIPIIGFNRRLLEGKIRSEEERIDIHQIIQSSSEFILDFIEKTSAALKQKSSLCDFHPETINLKDIVVLSAKGLIPSAEERGLTILINGMGAERWDEIKNMDIKADHSQLKTMIENLLGNAIKYAQNKIELRLDECGAETALVVSDDGPGISCSYHEKIFDEYFQVPGSKEGTGLGLFSVKKVIENHGGQVTVSSLDGNGCSFEVIFAANQVKCYNSGETI